MNAFLSRALFFCLPLLVIALSFEILLRMITNDYLLKKQYLDRHSQEIEVLILGNSHSYYGLNPSYFSSKAFNAGYISQSLDLDLLIIQKYQEKFAKLHTIVLPISSFSLFTRLEMGTEAWRIKNYTIYFDVDVSSNNTNRFELTSNRLAINFKRLYSYFFQGESNISSSKLGWGVNYQSSNAKNLIESGLTAANRHSFDLRNDFRKSVFDENISILKSIATHCAEQGIILFLFTPPAYESYRQGINREQLDAAFSAAEEIASSNDKCTYINLFHDPRFVAEDYYDADHLSEIGAEKLSKLIDELIRNCKN